MKNIHSWIAMGIKAICAAAIALLGLAMSIPTLLISALSIVMVFLGIYSAAYEGYDLFSLDLFQEFPSFFVNLFIFFVSGLLLIGCIVLFFIGIYLLASSISSLTRTLEQSYEVDDKKKAALKSVTLVPVEMPTQDGGTTVYYTIQ